MVGPDYLVSRDGDRPHVEVMAAANPRDPKNLLAGAITFTRPDGGAATKAYVSFDGGVQWDDIVFPEQKEHGGGDPRVLPPGGVSGAVRWRLKLAEPIRIPNLHLYITAREVVAGPR